MKELSREAKRVIRKADQALETGAITYSRHRTMTPLEKKAAKEIVKGLQEDRQLNRKERRARERKLRRRKNPRKA